MKRLFLVLALGLGVLLTGCSDSPFAPKEAEFEITDTSYGMTSYDCPYVQITVKNVGNATGYNAACYAHAKNSGGTIIDTGFAYFAGGGDIDPGESAQDDAIFFDLSSWSEIASVEYDLSWLTRK